MSNHSFDIHIAEEYKSVEIAILVWHFQYWIMKNKRLGKNRHEGRTWTYQTILEIAAVFPYWSHKQVERLINKAIELKILVKGNFNKSNFDRTIWYAFENEEKFSISRFREMEAPESGNPNDGIGKPIPDTIPYTLTNKEREGASTLPHISFSEKAKENGDSPESRRSEVKNLEALPFGQVASSFFEKIHKFNPKIKQPKLQKWAKDLELLANDGNSEADIVRVIDYVIGTSQKPASNGFCWANVVLCPASLRKNFAKIWGEMKVVEASSSKVEKAKCDEEDAEKNEIWLKGTLGSSRKPTRQSSNVDHNGITFFDYDNSHGQSDRIYYKDPKFRELVIHELRKRKYECM